MSNKSKKKQKPRKQKPRKVKAAEEQNFPVKTIWLMLVSGVVIAAWIAFPQVEWWGRPSPEIIAVRDKLLTLIVASMTLASLLLTANDAANIRRGFPLIVTGLVAWGAAFTTVPDPNLGVAFFMLWATTPLFIAFAGPRMPRIPSKAVPLCLLVAGLAMVVSSFVLANTKAGLVMLALIDFAASELVIAILGVSGLGIIIFALTWGAARLLGNAANPM